MARGLIYPDDLMSWYKSLRLKINTDGRSFRMEAGVVWQTWQYAEGNTLSSSVHDFCTWTYIQCLIKVSTVDFWDNISERPRFWTWVRWLCKRQTWTMLTLSHRYQVYLRWVQERQGCYVRRANWYCMIRFPLNAKVRRAWTINGSGRGRRQHNIYLLRMHEQVGRMVPGIFLGF